MNQITRISLITLDNLMTTYNIKIQFNLAKTFIIILLIL
jgi:hypothetical protein